MKLKNLAIIALAGGAVTAIAAAGPALRRGEVRVPTPKGVVSVTPVARDAFRVTTLPADGSAYAPSQSVVGESVVDDVFTWADGDSTVIVNGTTTAVIDRNTGRVSFRDTDGALLLTEAGGVANNGALKSVSLLPAKQGFLYGAGERGHRMTLNGDSLTMYNRQNYGYGEGDPRISQMGISVPWFSSDAGYGVLFDDYNRAGLELGDTVRYVSDTPLPLSYYFMRGGDLAGNSAIYSQLTGRQPLPPAWTLGYITSKYGYHNQDEALGAIDTLRRHGYPIDGMVLDLYWYGQETDMGRLAWDPKRWPDHKMMLDSLLSLGIHTVTISQPYINKIGAIDNYNLLDSLDLLTRDADGKRADVTTWVGEAGMFDVSNPRTREWLWNRLRPLTAEGISGWWGDLGEPEVHPLNIVHDNGQTAEQYHNAYGNQWSQLIYDGLRRDFPEMRPMLMMRGGTAGLQRYGVFPWTTDVARDWKGLQPQVKLMLSSGLSGLGYMSSDIGGFAVDPKKPLDPELYVRWLQLGTFTPMLRTHAQLQPEPFNFPKQEDIIRRFIKMRYEWFPYNYTLAYENAAYGLPLARPLNFRGDNPGKEYADVADEYLWGDNVLVAPVMTQGAKSRKVLFPKGTWYSWDSPRTKYTGGKTYTVQAPLAKLPLFVRAGSFIPQYDRPLNNTSEYNPSFLTVKYFPSAEETSYVLFDDDRKSPTSLEDRQYQLTTFKGSYKAGKLSISISSEGTYKGMPKGGRQLTILVEDVAKPKTLSATGIGVLPEGASAKAIRQYGWTYDPRARQLTIKLPYAYEPITVTGE